MHYSIPKAQPSPLNVPPGASKFDVVWLHNDKEIKPSKDFEYDSAGDLYSLKIAEIFPEDAGAYTCEAFNDAGESFSSCTLVVLGEPQAPDLSMYCGYRSTSTVLGSI